MSPQAAHDVLDLVAIAAAGARCDHGGPGTCVGCADEVRATLYGAVLALVDDHQGVQLTLGDVDPMPLPAP